MNSIELDEKSLGWGLERLTYTAEDIKQIAVLLNMNRRSISATYSAFIPKDQSKEDHAEMWLSKIEKIAHLLAVGVLPEKMNRALWAIWEIQIGPNDPIQVSNDDIAKTTIP